MTEPIYKITSSVNELEERTLDYDLKIDGDLVGEFSAPDDEPIDEMRTLPGQNMPDGDVIDSNGNIVGRIADDNFWGSNHN